MNTYAKRREKLLKRIDGNCAVILFSGNAINKSEDENYPFDVNRNFYYLTGLENESMVLLMNRINGVCTEELFILPYDEILAKWVGGRMSAKEAARISGIGRVSDCSALDETVAYLLNRNRKDPDFGLYFDLWHYSVDQPLTPALKYVSGIREKHPAVKIMDIYPHIGKMRLVKDREEVACIRKALDITGKGVRKMMKDIRQGMNEMQMEGTFRYVLYENLCSKPAFDTIAAGGKRATVLHYHENDHELKDGELFLCDLGASYKNYCADISRTFPVNGRFTKRQKEIYELVLGAQKLVEENAKPGVTMGYLNGLVIDYYRKELPKHGLKKDVREYYYHSVSHHLGLDTHDIDGGMGAVLEEGNVITNEPGLYIEKEKIGIRIEDDLLITKDGCENLAAGIPKTVEDIEKTAKR